MDKYILVEISFVIKGFCFIGFMQGRFALHLISFEKLTAVKLFC